VEEGTQIQGDLTEDVSFRYESLESKEQDTIRDEFIDYIMEMCEVPRYVAEETEDWRDEFLKECYDNRVGGIAKHDIPEHVRKQFGLYEKKAVNIKNLSWSPTMTVSDFVDSNIYTFYNLYCEWEDRKITDDNFEQYHDEVIKYYVWDMKMIAIDLMDECYHYSIGEWQEEPLFTVR